MLPDSLTYLDGAQVACGFGTVYEALQKIGIDGGHAVLITGLGPVGLAAGALCRKLGAEKIIGIDISAERRELALRLALCDEALTAGADNVSQSSRAHRRPWRRTRGGVLCKRGSASNRDLRDAKMGQDRHGRRRRNSDLQSFARH
jgi:threonine dehydrogenase-like Zn-dependent dehydrogenase